MQRFRPHSSNTIENLQAGDKVIRLSNVNGATELVLLTVKRALKTKVETTHVRPVSDSCQHVFDKFGEMKGMETCRTPIMIIPHSNENIEFVEERIAQRLHEQKVNKNRNEAKQAVSDIYIGSDKWIALNEFLKTL